MSYLICLIISNSIYLQTVASGFTPVEIGTPNSFLDCLIELLWSLNNDNGLEISP